MPIYVQIYFENVHLRSVKHMAQGLETAFVGLLSILQPSDSLLLPFGGAVATSHKELCPDASKTVVKWA